MLFQCAAARARLTRSSLHASAPRQESSCKPSNTPPQTLEEQAASIRTFSLLGRADGNGIHFLLCVRSTWSFPFLPDPISVLRGSFFVCFFFNQETKKTPEITTCLFLFSNSWIFCWGEGVEVPLLLSSMINLQLRKCCAVTALGCDWWRPKLQPSWTRRSPAALHIYSLDLLVTE